jgi:lipopolysaccharide export system permease protein
LTTLDRYLLREIAIPFAVGLGLFFVVVAFAQVLKVSDAATGLGVTGGEVVQALIYTLPPLMGLLIPVSLFFATQLAVGRIASDREVIAMASAGVTPFRLLRVPILLGVLLAGVSAFTLIVGEPWGLGRLDVLMSAGAQRALASGVRIGEFTQWGGISFTAGGEKDGKLQDVVFMDRRNANSPVAIFAKRGSVLGGKRAQDLVFELEDGTVRLSNEESKGSRVLRFQKSRYRFDVGGRVTNKLSTVPEAQKLPLAEIWRRAHDPERSRRAIARYTITFHRKIAFPLATIIFALLAVPLAVRATGGARARGFLYSAGIVGAYYYVGRAAELAARGGRFDPTVAAWLPNLLGLIVVILMLYRLPRRAV